MIADLARSLLSEEIRTLHQGRRSGVLSVSGEGVTKGIFLRGGRVVFASSSLEKDRLGESLIRLGRISRREFAAAYEATRLRRRRLGQTLLAAGVMTEAELARILAHQVQVIVLSLFKWTEGEMRFEDASEPIPADLALDLSTHRLLFEGTRIYPDPTRLERALGDPLARVRVAARPPFDPGRVSFSPAERAVLKDAASETRIRDMLGRPGARPLLVRALYALLAGGILETGGQEPGIVEGDTGSFQLALPEPSAAPLAENGRERILRLYEAMPRATHYEALGVPPEAAPHAIEEVYRRLIAQLETDGRELARDVQLGSVISTLGLRWREAHRVLSDPHRRAAYDRALGSLRPARPAGVKSEAHDRARSLTREAVAHLERGRRERAVPLLLRAVDLDPKDRDGHRLLALTLAEHPKLFRTAERHFVTALEMDPRDADLRFRLALYYEKVGLAARALIQLQALLANHPGHHAARRELATLQAGGGRP